MADERLDLRGALGELLSTGRVSPSVRPEIATSWRRSAASDLRPDRFEAPFEPPWQSDERLTRAARPVLERLSEDLDSSTMIVLLSDVRGSIIDRLVRERRVAERLDSVGAALGHCYDERRVGTNAIGTALARGAPSMVVGDEHFADALTDTACAAAPIIDPASAAILGAVDLACPAERSHPLMLALAVRTARDIEQRLGSPDSAADRVLLDAFIAARRGARGALVAVSGRAMYTNAPAVRLVQDIERTVLWGLVRSALGDGRRADVELPVPRGDWSTLSCETITDGAAVAGALLRVVPRPPAGAAGGPDREPEGRRTTVGWESLTETERSVAALVSEGRTNRQIAAATFLSPHTVGYHLRHIFYKLGVSSRVELTRVVVLRGREAD